MILPYRAATQLEFELTPSAADAGIATLSLAVPTEPEATWHRLTSVAVWCEGCGQGTATAVPLATLPVAGRRAPGRHSNAAPVASVALVLSDPPTPSEAGWQQLREQQGGSEGAQQQQGRALLHKGEHEEEGDDDGSDHGAASSATAATATSQVCWGCRLPALSWGCCCCCCMWSALSLGLQVLQRECGHNAIPRPPLPALCRIAR